MLRLEFQQVFRLINVPKFLQALVINPDVGFVLQLAAVSVQGIDAALQRVIGCLRAVFYKIIPNARRTVLFDSPTFLKRMVIICSSHNIFCPLSTIKNLVT